MGAAFDCRCNDCDHEFKVVQGGGFSFVHVCCDGCGDTKSLPRYAPRCKPEPVVAPIKKLTQAVGSLVSGLSTQSNQVPDLSEEQLRAYFEKRDQPRWVSQGNSWRDGEWQTLLSFLGDCSCGGRWVEPVIPSGSLLHGLHRCPKCRSRSFKYWYPDIVFD
jgi:hypothetical protein